MPEYFITVSVMRGTIRWILGDCTRQQLRQALRRRGWTEPDLSNYLDMVRRAMGERRLTEKERS